MDYTNILNDIYNQVNCTEDSINHIESTLQDVTTSTAITATMMQQIDSKLNIFMCLFIIYMCFEIVKIRGERR